MLRSGGGEDGGFQPLAWPVSSVVVMAGLWTSMSLWLPTKVEVKNVVFGTYPPDVDQEWVEV